MQQLGMCAWGVRCSVAGQLGRGAAALRGRRSRRRAAGGRRCRHAASGVGGFRRCAAPCYGGGLPLRRRGGRLCRAAWIAWRGKRRLCRAPARSAFEGGAPLGGGGCRRLRYRLTATAAAENLAVLSFGRWFWQKEEAVSKRLPWQGWSE